MAIPRTPATCRWAERRVVAGMSSWLQGWRTRWSCLLRGPSVTVEDEDCSDCPGWQPHTELTGAVEDRTVPGKQGEETS
jgi:hypothetical protein